MTTYARGFQIGDSVAPVPIADLSVGAGDRNPASAVASYKVVRQEANASIISKATAVTIGGGVANDTHLMAVVITKALTGTCVITGFPDTDGNAKIVTYPAATAADTYNWYGALNTAGALTVTCGDAGDDDNVIILWRPV